MKKLATTTLAVLALSLAAHAEGTGTHSSSATSDTSATTATDGSTTMGTGTGTQTGAAQTTKDGSPQSQGTKDKSTGLWNNDSQTFGATSQMSKDQVRKAQAALNNELTIGIAEDGVIGAETRAAIRQFQTEQGLQVTGTLDTATAQALGLLEDATIDRVPASVPDAKVPSPDNAVDSNTNF